MVDITDKKNTLRFASAEATTVTGTNTSTTTATAQTTAYQNL